MRSFGGSVLDHQLDDLGLDPAALLPRPLLLPRVVVVLVVLLLWLGVLLRVFLPGLASLVQLFDSIREDREEVLDRLSVAEGLAHLLVAKDLKKQAEQVALGVGSGRLSQNPDNPILRAHQALQFVSGIRHCLFLQFGVGVRKKHKCISICTLIPSPKRKWTDDHIIE